MEITYKTYQTDRGETFIQAFLPNEVRVFGEWPANSDYQAYLATLAANSATPQA